MLLKDIIIELLAGPVDLDHLSDLKKVFSRKNKLASLPSNIEILQAYRSLVAEKAILPHKWLEQLLKKRAIRSESGIVAIQVLTKPYVCPGQCIFCPNDPEMPKSYIKTEPGAARALLNQFDPIKQVHNRLISLSLTGHETDKIEMIILGWTWDVYPETYKRQFVQSLYDACTVFSQLHIESHNDENGNQQKYGHTLSGWEDVTLSDSLEEALARNQSADHRIIGLTVETRPEYVTDTNCQLWRELGITRIEMWVQSLFDDVLLANKRGHTVDQIRKACHGLRKYGFKFSVHIMPGLYKSTYEKDLETFRLLYSDPYLKPDEIKFYPTSVIPNTVLSDLYQAGEYKPLETDVIKTLIQEVFLNVIPPYTRIKRLIRDIPATEIEAGSKVTNLSQLMHIQIERDLQSWLLDAWALYERLYPNYQLFENDRELLKLVPDFIAQNEDFCLISGTKPDVDQLRSFVCLDTRSREVRNKSEIEDDQINLVIRWYHSSVGQELFISYEDHLGYLYGFTRLLLPAREIADVDGLGKSTAIIRELHVYWMLQSLRHSSHDEVQHTWFGKALMSVAEIVSKRLEFQRLSVISGVGVRPYYKWLWYVLEWTYMVKYL